MAKLYYLKDQVCFSMYVIIVLRKHQMEGNIIYKKIVIDFYIFMLCFSVGLSLKTSVKYKFDIIIIVIRNFIS